MWRTMMTVVTRRGRIVWCTPPLAVPLSVCRHVLPGQHEQEQGHAQVRRRGVHPDAERQRVQEPEQLRLLFLRSRVQYAYAQRHERRREVHRGPPIERDRQVAYRQVRALPIVRGYIR